MDDAQSNPLDQVWRALADPTRRDLLDLLRTGPKTTGQLVEAVPALSRFGVMKHLGVLEEAGLLTVSRQGRQRYNHLNAVPLRQVYKRWVSKYEDTWAGSLLSLKRLAERKEQTMSAKISDKPARIAHVQIQIDINAKKETVFAAWFEDTHKWFFETEADIQNRPTRCDRELGGHFYIELPDGGFNALAQITMIKPNKSIRMRGDCTIPSAMVCNMTITFEEANGITTVKVDHRMSGEFDDDLPAGFEEGWADGLQKLKQLVES